MDSRASSCYAPFTSSSSILFPRRILPSRPAHFSLASKSNDSEADPESASKDVKSVPILKNLNLSLSPLSKDAAMGLVLSAAAGRGWTTGSGMEGPPVPDGSEAKSSTENVSTFPWSLFTKSPRRRMLVAFTCNICGQRTTRAINPHAYTDGTVFVQCCGCSAFHKLVDNLNLFHEMNCYVNPSFSYGGNGWEDMNFKYMDVEDEDDIFPIQ
ncbi:Mitochondrial protein import protein ZIM17 [Morus notabilis]|uniref:Mitochondrial protein import protein ZIM17 n=1 Tax=Morus notabilis TaxID=981085 RepID=W9QBV3_9ROSA|nr:uncharacterized protein LOC21389519 [Morus notabilis]EXB24041.1 Mitochondrial protein import protein ZIM17 [Morus notabilis]